MAEHLDDGGVNALPVESYNQLRPRLRSGDLFFCSGNYLLSRAIRHFTHSPWSHVAIVFAVREIERALLLESVEDVGVRFAPLSKYLADYEDGQPYDGALVFARPSVVTAEVVTRLAGFGCDQLTLPYDTEETASISARIALGIGRKKESHAFICSELVYECFRSAGYEFAHTADFVSPEDIWRDSSVALLGRVR